MAQSLTILVPLARYRTGLSLRAQLRDTAGVAVGSLVSTGFVECQAPSGHYEWFYAAYPDGFEGRVDFTISGAPTVNVATAVVNNADFGVVATASATSIATAVWASGTRTLTSFGTLVADVAAAVWAYATRTLTMTAAQIIASITSSATITFHRGDTCTINLTGLGDLSDRTKLYLTVKESVNDEDTAALLQFEETAGLLRLNGAAPASAADGSLVVTNQVAGNVTITLKPAASKELELSSRRVYDVQKHVGTSVYSSPVRRAVVEEDVTRGVS